MEKVIFLDRDGTINKDFGYVHVKEQFQLLPGVIVALKRLQEAGYMLIFVTNQSGIARGYFTEETFLDFDNWIKMYLQEQGIKVEKTYYCPHHPEAKVEKYRKNCSCRKPNLQLFKEAIKEYNIDVTQSFLIGDRKRDVQLCLYENIEGYVIYSSEEKKEGNIHFITGGLLEATDLILER